MEDWRVIDKRKRQEEWITMFVTCFIFVVCVYIFKGIYYAI